MPAIRCGDVVIDYDLVGEGPPLVFVHGAFTDRNMWRPQVERFSASHRCLTFDLRGHGATGPNRRRDYTVDLYAADMTCLLDALGLGRVSFVGSSLGGMIAQVFAQRHPERIERLFLLSSFADTTGPQPDLPPLHLAPNWMTTLVLRVWGMKRFVAYAKSRAAKMQGYPVASSDEDPPMVFMKPSEIPKIYKSIFTFKAQPSREFGAPVLIACGEREHPAMKSHSERLARLYETELVEIHGAGHIASLEATEAFNQLIDDFLADRTRGGVGTRPAQATLGVD